jgi:hypothetical protein
MRDRRFAPIFILLLVGLGIVFFLQNSTPTLPLVFFGMEWPSLPLAAWLVLGAIAGFVTSLALGGLWRRSQRNLRSQATRFAERDWEEDTHREPTPSKRSRKKTAKRKAAATRQDNRQPPKEQHSEAKPDELDELNEPAPWDNWEEPKDTPINVEATATEGGKPRDQQLRTKSGDPTTPVRETDDEFPEDEQENELATNTTEWLGEEFFEDWKQELDRETEPSDTGEARDEVPPGKTYERYRQPIRQYWSGSVYSYTYGDPETSTTSEVDENQNQTPSPETASDQVPLESEADPSEVEVSADVPTTPQPPTQETAAEEVSWDESLEELEIEDRETKETVGDDSNETSSQDFSEEDDQDWQTGPSNKFRPYQNQQPSQAPTSLAQRFVQKIVSPNQPNPQPNTPEEREKADQTNDAKKSLDDWEDDWENKPKNSNNSDDW